MSADDRKEAEVAGASPAHDRDGLLAGDEDTPSMAVWVIATRSRSRYVVAKDVDGVWWLAGRNIANPNSASLPPLLWRIEAPTPWPPLLGAPACLIAARDLAISDPMRVPGGGKVTSPVEIILKLPTGASDAWQEEHHEG